MVKRLLATLVLACLFPAVTLKRPGAGKEKELLYKPHFHPYKNTSIRFRRLIAAMERPVSNHLPAIGKERPRAVLAPLRGGRFSGGRGGAMREEIVSW